MKKALKIINDLEKITSRGESRIRIVNKEGNITLEKKGNQVLLQIFHLLFFIGIWIVVYFQRFELNLIVSSILIFCSITTVLSYFKGAYQTDNRIEINLNLGEIKIKRKSFFGKLTRADRIIKTQKGNKIIKKNVPLSDSFDIRLIFENTNERIALLDLREDSNLDRIFLSLNLLVKHEI